MEGTQLSLEIQIDWERLDQGTAEERACFGALAIRWNDIALTAGHDFLVNRVRSEPLLSGYHLAEWVAWNWWRLRWEPRSAADDWALAHRLTTIGAGYVWPNITIFSDGERIALIAKPTSERPSTAFRYISDVAAVVQANVFEAAIDQFMEQIRGQLTAEGIGGSNLESTWRDVQSERADLHEAKCRKLEALLGQEPDGVSSSVLAQLVAESGELGESAVEELAADSVRSQHVPTRAELHSIADSHGHDARRVDMAHLAPGTGLPPVGTLPAWRLGARAAMALRSQLRLGNEPISDNRLTSVAGVQSSVLSDQSSYAMSFALDQGSSSSKFVLRSKWRTGRRFELARLLGDRVVKSWGGKLFPATRAYTYRQKVQRAFAAEFLSPFESVEEFLRRDYSSEAQQDCAQEFQVSEMTIRTLLMNHGRIEREFPEEEFEMRIGQLP